MNQRGWLAYLKHFTILFIPLSVLFGLVTTFFWHQEQKAHLLLMQTEKRQQVETLRRVANDDLRTVISDLYLLSVNPMLYQLMEYDLPETRQALATVFKAFSENTQLYDQVRFLDETGMERVRVNFTGGVSTIVPEEKLQNKSRRYYFQDTFALNPGQVFVSPFDLNIEHGQIEQPLKPMIRFGMPVVDTKGHRHGIVLLNYLGRALIDHLQQVAMRSSGQFMLLNSDGYWLKGKTSEQEWGFMFGDRKELTLAQRDPAAWEIIANHEEGQFTDDQGIYTFATIRPLNRNMLSSTGTAQAYGPSRGHLTGKEMYWKVAILFSAEALAAQNRALQISMLPFAGTILFLIAAASGGFTIVRVQRQQAAEERLYREKLQAVLEMAGGVCHELNQPMQVIVGYCDLLMMEREDDQSCSDKILKVKEQIERLGDITKKLSRITRYETTDHVDDRIVDIHKSAYQMDKSQDGPTIG